MIRLCVLSAGLLLAGAAASVQAAGTPDPRVDTEPRYTFAIVYPVVDAFFDPITAQAMQRGAERSVRIIARASKSGDAEEQVEIMRTLIALGVDGIAIAPADEERLAPWVDRAIENGIPTVTFETDIRHSSRNSFIGTNQFRAGEHIAHVIAREVNYRGTVLLSMGLSTQWRLLQRVQGVEDALRQYHPNVRIISVSSGDGSPLSTRSAIEHQLAAHPDFDVLVCVDATGGPTAIAIWKAMGWSAADRRLVTFDDTSESIGGLHDGIVSAVVTQAQWVWGELIVDRLIDINQGTRVPEYLDTGTIEITPQNASVYRKFLMFPGTAR